ncbi:Methionine aminopeptidase [Pantoea agglomerans]|uniref:Methionine aminopeptidase n=1 Tax=Enterobacter agglomerans TaxID=549 RepID=A0A379LS66_ENTAG|nr:Methionine aminopeptidase [Pantoea agglomerans]
MWARLSSVSLNRLASRWCVNIAVTASVKFTHTDPQVLHYGTPGEGMPLKAGMIFTIEPMINAGKAGTSVLSDGWTVVTKDRSLSAQWEHTVAVTDEGFDLLTPWPEGTGDYPAI